MSRFSAKIALLTCAAASCGALALPASAPAAPYMVSVMQDDNQLAYGTPSQRRAALDRMKGLGVEAIRVTVLWRAIAPDPTARKKPRGFNGADPGDYPRHHWDKYDDLVLAAQQRGIIVYFNPTGSGPRWAHATTREAAAQRSFRPSPEEFRKFTIAVGRRYSGRYRDENNGRGALPRVEWWAIWNEPNQPGWLTPQGEKKKGVGMVPMSPHVYRDLLVAGAKGLRQSGHGDDLVLIGELAPLGFEKPQGTRPAIRPGLFLRELFCVNRRYRPYSGRQARARGCEDVDSLNILLEFPRIGFAHHPYTKKLSPQKRDKGRDAMTMANINTLPKALDKIAARTGLIPAEMPVFLTEYGYETSPPDPFSGVSPALQAEYINEGDYIAWRHPRIFSNAQFQLFDVPPRDDFPRDSQSYWFTYQSGLYTAQPNAQPKIAATAYAFPLVVRQRGANARIWGQVRFTPNGATQLVTLQVKQRGSNTWTRSGDVIEVTHNQGFFEVTRPSPPGATWRAVWLERDLSGYRLSREAVAR
jgi:hypothetical protein